MDKLRLALWSRRSGTINGATEHLAHLAARRPFVVPYLTLPIGYAVSFEPEGAFIFAPGKEESRRDPGKPYDFGPWSLID